jgi:hypothetical protein
MRSGRNRALYGYADQPPQEPVQQPSPPANTQSGGVATGCLKVAAFLILFPIFCAMPLAWNAFFTWIGSVLYFYRKDDDHDRR